MVFKSYRVSIFFGNAESNPVKYVDKSNILINQKF